MKRNIAFVMVSLLLLATLVPVGLGCSGGDTIEWTVATYSLPGDTETQILEDFASMVEEESDGKLKIRVATAGELYSDTDIFPAVSNGNIELGLVNLGLYYQQMPKYVSVFSQVWGDTVDDQIAYRDALEDLDFIAEEFDTYNIQPLMYFSTGWLEYYFIDPIENFPADAAGRKLVSPGAGGDPIIQNILMATPVTIDVSEIAQQAQTHQIDGIAIMPVLNYYKNQMYTIIPYLVMTRSFNAPYQCQMNRDAFNSLDEDLQQIVLDAAAAYQIIGLDKVDEELQDALDDMKDNNLATIIELTGAAQVEFKAAISASFEYGMTFELSEAELAEVYEVKAEVDADLAA